MAKLYLIIYLPTALENLQITSNLIHYFSSNSPILFEIVTN